MFTPPILGLNADRILQPFLRKVVALPEWVTTWGLSLDTVEQAYQEAVQGVSI